MSQHFPAMDAICPMHAVVDAKGHILHAGPTLCKLRPTRTLPGLPFLELFEITRPGGIESPAALWSAQGRKLHLRFRDSPHTAMTAICVAEPRGDGLLVNVSFGISILEALQIYSLTNADFAPTDLTIEMLYLVEAKSAAMAASRKLNDRLQGAKLAAEEQAVTDALTGLKNRRGLEQILDRLIAREADFALMHADLDFFKQINDTLGHDAGDFILGEVARIMTEETRDRDVVARVGGDEFVLLIDGTTPPAAITRIAIRLIERISTPMMFQNQTCQISCSIGTVLTTDYETVTLQRLYKDADLALYASKNAGRGRHTFFEAGHQSPT